MHIEDPDRDSRSSGTPHHHPVGELRLIALDEASIPQRRRTPRRRLVMPVAADRRRTERRRTMPGVDGLMRTVLADDWR